MNDIKLFVFDLHGTLTPETKQLNVIQKRLKEYIQQTYPDVLPMNYTSDMYIESLQQFDYNIADLCPKFGLLSDFTSNLTEDQHVAVASSGTSEPFAYAILKYCYDKSRVSCPFIEETVISSRTIGLPEYRERYGQISSKVRHIRVIIDRLSDEIALNEVLMIDNSRRELDAIKRSDERVQTMLVKNYFSGICQKHGDNGHYICSKCPGVVFCERENCH